MKKNEVKKREQLSKELEMNFDETLELFSEETLGTMMMTEVIGGVDNQGFNFISCSGSNISLCTNTNCPCTTLNAITCNKAKSNCKPY